MNKNEMLHTIIEVRKNINNINIQLEKIEKYLDKENEKQIERQVNKNIKNNPNSFSSLPETRKYKNINSFQPEITEKDILNLYFACYENLYPQPDIKREQKSFSKEINIIKKVLQNPFFKNDIKELKAYIKYVYENSDKFDWVTSLNFYTVFSLRTDSLYRIYDENKNKSKNKIAQNEEYWRAFDNV